MSDYGYTLFVYKKDNRCKTGERLVGKYAYPNYSGNAMMNEINELRHYGYRSSEGYRLDFEFGLDL